MSPGSRQILCWFAGVVVSSCKLGRSQSFGRGMVFVFSSCPGPGTIQLHVGLAGNAGVDGVADSGYSNWWGHELCCGCGSVGCGGTGVVGSAAEASPVGFPVLGERPVRSCISWKRYVDDVVGGSRVFCCSCIFVFLRACYPVPISLVSGADTDVHTWVDVELRVVGQHVAVNIKNPNRAWVHNRGPQQKSTFLLWTTILKNRFNSIQNVVLGHLARTKVLGLPEQFGVARLLEDVVELVCMVYPLSVIRGLVHSVPCSRVAQIGRKTVRTWLSFYKKGICF